MSLARNEPAFTPLATNEAAGSGRIVVVAEAGNVGSADQRSASCVTADALTENLQETCECKDEQAEQRQKNGKRAR